MSYFSLRKHTLEEPTEVDEDAALKEPVEDDPGPVQEPEDHKVPGLLPALWQGARNWCAWCAGRIGTGPAWGVHGVAGYAAVNYNAWVTGGVTSVFVVLAFVFAPRDALERAAARLEARDKARHHPPQTAPDSAPETPGDPLVALLWQLIADAPGTHLKTLTHTIAQGALKQGAPAPTKADVEAALTARGIPLRPSVRDTRGKVNRGVHREDLTAWQETTSPTDGAPPATAPVADVS